MTPLPTPQSLAGFFKMRRRPPPALPGYCACAVLVPFVVRRRELHVLFIQRSEHLRHHKGQIAFPGGIQEPEDPSLLHTALRETEEEIALPPEKVQVLGSLMPIYTPTRYCIHPFVGLMEDPFEPQPNPREIGQVLFVPLKHLLNPKNKTLEPLEFFPRKFHLPSFHYGEHVIWGATGKITQELIEKLEK